MLRLCTCIDVDESMTATPPPRLLLIEDDPDTAALICETLSDHFRADCVSHFSTIEQTLCIDIHQYDLVLSDMNLPDGSGLELMAQLRTIRDDIPIVFVTGEGVLENAMTAIRQGAYDYIVKAGDYLFAIPIVVEKNIAIWLTKQENKRLQFEVERTLEQVRIKNCQLEDAVRKLETVAATDPLTELANRRAFNEAMERSFAECSRYGHDLACVMIDLDNFKTINDTLGHQHGDQLLQLVGRILGASCRRSDVAGRYGGDEFVVLLPETDRLTALAVARRVHDEFIVSVKQLVAGTAVAHLATMSIGLACMRDTQASSPDRLITKADQAMYRAKNTRADDVLIFEPDEPQRVSSTAS